MTWINKIIFFAIWCIFIQKFVLSKNLNGRSSKLKDEIEDLITSAGYEAESHNVETEDLYQLKVHRVRAKSRSTNKNLAPVFLMHGLFATAADYLMTGAQIALPYLLSDNGFDVWLGNSRGNDFSLLHKKLSVHSIEYWNFSWNEIGYYDLPAMVDHVLDVSNSSKLFYVGHSQGCTSLMVLLSLRPNYNDKIIEAHLMAPAVFMNNFPNTAIRFFANEFESYVQRNQYYDFLSSAQVISFFQPIATTVCQKNSPMKTICGDLIQSICGKNDNELEIDPNVMAILFKYLARAVSVKQINHFIQLYQGKKFQQYNYQYKNKFIYNLTSPPEYDLNNVKCPIHIYVAKNDYLVAEKDIEHLKEVLPNVKKYRVIKSFNHCDFNYATRSRANVYTFILKSFNQYYHN